MLDKMEHKKLKILIFSWRGPGHPNSGGAEISTHEHAKGWVRAGHSVTLFTSFYLGAKEEELIDGVKVIRSGPQTLGVQIEAFNWYCFKNHPKFDLVIDQFHGIPFFTPLYVKVKKLGFIHEVTKEVWRLNPWPIPLNFMVAILGTLLEPLIFRLYKKIPFMTVSESSRRDLVQWGINRNKISVIHNGTNTPKFLSSPPKESKKTLIYLGALAKDKGIEDTLRIFSILSNSDQNFQFWVVGKSDPGYLKKIKLQISNLHLEGKVKFWGFVTERVKYELLARAHILINPSVREGWGLVVIEAASVRTPTVAFNVTGLRDSIIDGKTGILCKDKTVKCLADEIMKLLNDERELKNLSENAYNWSKNFSWEKATKNSLKLIENLIKNSIYKLKAT